MSFILGDQLGEGTYGTVYECDHIENGVKKRKKAIKCISLKGRYRCIFEASIMATYKHPYLSRAEEVVVDNDELYIVQKLAKCDLAAVSRGNPLPLHKVRKYVYCITKALHFLHSRNIVHGDVKANNVLIYDNDQVKLTDYSLSLLMFKSNYNHRVGTCSHKAPECFKGKSWSYPIDSWALGCTIYELVYGFNIIPKQRQTSEYSSDELYYHSIMEWLSEIQDITPDPSRVLIPFTRVKHSRLYDKREYRVVNDLIMNLLRFEPEKRYTMNEILEHRFFNDINIRELPVVIKKHEKWDITPKVADIINRLNLRSDIKTIVLNLVSYCLNMKDNINRICGCCVVLAYILKKEEIPEKYKKYNAINVLEHLDFSFHEAVKNA